MTASTEKLLREARYHFDTLANSCHDQRLRDTYIDIGCRITAHLSSAPSAANVQGALVMVEALRDEHRTAAHRMGYPDNTPLYAAPPLTAQGDAWLPINSAPYNKTRVALIHSDGKGYVRYGVGWYMPLTGWQGWDGGDNYLQPTHWYPLPAAPTPAASGMDNKNS